MQNAQLHIPPSPPSTKQLSKLWQKKWLYEWLPDIRMRICREELEKLASAKEMAPSHLLADFLDRLSVQSIFYGSDYSRNFFY